MIRREFLGIAAALAFPAWLHAQVKLRVAVTDRHGRHIRGLKPGDFRVLEDGIAQKISAFEDGESNQDQEHAYTITYHSDPSNRNEGFRKIIIEIVSDKAKNYRVRTRPGYRTNEFQ